MNNLLPSMDESKLSLMKDMLLTSLTEYYCHANGYDSDLVLATFAANKLVNPMSAEKKEASKRNKYLQMLDKLCREQTDSTIPHATKRLQSDFTIESQNETGNGNMIINVTHRLDSQPYIIKCVPYSPGIEKEVSIHAGIYHPNIVRYHTSWLEWMGSIPYLMIQMEACDGDIEQINNKLTKPRHITETIDQTANAIEYLHNKGIIHRDIKLSNMLYNRITDDRLIIKLCDYGSARYLHRELQPTTNEIVVYDPQKAIYALSDDTGTQLYAAPEQLTANYSDKVDNYSLGLAFYELITKPNRISRLIEFNGMKENTSIVNIPHGNNKLIKLAKKMLHHNPKYRYNLNTFRKHLRSLT